jgi:hypothetical protein
MNKSELRQEVMARGSFFFDRSSMRFFGDTMANYYVPKATVVVEDCMGEQFRCFELQRRRPVKHGLCDSSYFAIDTFKRVLPTN